MEKKRKGKNVIVGIAKAEAHTQITISLFLCTVSVWIVKSATPSTTERVLANLALIPNRLRRIDKAFLSPERWNLFKESGKVTIPSTVTAGPGRCLFDKLGKGLDVTPGNEGDFKMELFPLLDNLYVFVFVMVNLHRYGHLHKVDFERFVYM